MKTWGCPSQAKTIEAVEDFAARLAEALRLFAGRQNPAWKCTQEGLLCFKGLDMTHLPARLRRDIDRRFGAINNILSGYRLKNWEDYETISTQNLHRIQRLIQGFAFD